MSTQESRHTKSYVNSKHSPKTRKSGIAHKKSSHSHQTKQKSYTHKNNLQQISHVSNSHHSYHPCHPSSMSVEIPSLTNTITHPANNFVDLSVCNIQTEAMVDTGASISVVNQSLIDMIQQTLTINPPISTFCRGVGGTLHKFTGTVTLPLNFGTTKVYHTFHILPNCQHMILGIDFLHQHKTQLVFCENSLITIQGHSYSLHTKSKPHACISQTVRIPADSVYVVPISIPDSSDTFKWDEPILIEGLPLDHVCKDVFVTSCVDHLDQPGHAYCRIVNNSDYPIVIPKGYQIATVSNFDTTLLSSVDIDELTEHIAHIASLSTPDSSDAIKDDIKFNIDSTLPAPHKQKLLQWCLQNRAHFSTSHANIGRTDIVSHHIDMPPTKPIYQQAYRMSPENRQTLDTLLDDMLNHQLIEPSTSKWSSPCLLLNKPSGNGKRLVVDLRKVNKATIPSTYPLPHMETIWDAIGDAKPKIFSVLDLHSGFHQIPLDKESRQYTAFSTMDRHFQYCVMPQGLAGSPITFQKLMIQILQGLLYKCCVVFCDDILVYSPDFSTHMHDLQAVMDRLAQANLTLSPKKCEFGKKSIRYLGHILSEKGITPNPDRTAAIDNYPVPKKPQHIRRFTGMTGFYRRFIPRYAEIANPLTDLLKKDTKFKWSDSCQSAFHTLKKKLTSEPVLRYADHSRPFTLTTDASKTGISFILGQKDENGHDYVCYYGARALRKHEKNYGSTDLEALAVVEGVDKFHVYLIDKPFTIFTDHQALKYLIESKFKGKTGRMARWAQQLMPYNYTVVYKPGKTNVCADALSRVPYAADPTPQICSLGVTDLHDHTDMSQPNKFVQYHLSYNDQICVTPTEEGHLSAYTSQINEIQDAQPSTQLISLDTLPQAQQLCSELGPMYRYIGKGLLSADGNLNYKLAAEKDHYTILDNVLYHLPRPSKSHPNPQRQVAIPSNYRHLLLEHYHDSVAGGSHQGFDRTYNAMKAFYYWPNMYKDVYDYIKGCATCQTSKRAYHSLPPPLHPLPIAEVFERWHIDHICNLTKTPDGYQHILVVVDSTSKWVEAFPTKTQTAEETAQILYREIFTRYGAPRTLVSDRGKAFVSKLVKALCEIFSVKLAHTSPYKPSTNSTAERMNGFLLTSLRAYCNKSHSNWPQALPGVCMAYRCTPATQSTEYSPYYLVFGKDMSRPIDVNLKPKSTLPEDTKKTLDGFVEHLRTSQNIAKQNLARHQQESKQRYDKKAKQPDFAVGDLVLMKNMKRQVGKNPKLTPQWLDPQRIIEEGPNFTYKLRNEETGKVTTFINARNLHPFHTQPPLPPLDAQNPPQLQQDNPILPQPQSHNTSVTGGNDSQNPQTQNGNSDIAPPQQTPADIDNSGSTNDPPQQLPADNDNSGSNAVSQQTTAAPTPQPSISSKPPLVKKILSSQWSQGTKWYKVKLHHNNATRWVTPDLVPQDMVDFFNANYTMQGKKKRAKASPHFERVSLLY